MTDSLLDQTVVILGGSAGIGLATARVATAEGTSVVLTGRDHRRLKEAAREFWTHTLGRKLRPRKGSLSGRIRKNLTLLRAGGACGRSRRRRGGNGGLSRYSRASGVHGRIHKVGGARPRGAGG